MAVFGIDCPYCGSLLFDSYHCEYPKLHQSKNYLKNTKSETSRIIPSINTATKNAGIILSQRSSPPTANTQGKKIRRDITCGTKSQHYLMLSSTAFFLLTAASRAWLTAFVKSSVFQAGQSIDFRSCARPNDNKLKIARAYPGVMLIIYESRPNVTADTAAALCLMGRQCGHPARCEGIKIPSNIAISKILTSALKSRIR